MGLDYEDATTSRPEMKMKPMHFRSKMTFRERGMRGNGENITNLNERQSRERSPTNPSMMMGRFRMSDGTMTVLMGFPTILELRQL